MVVLSRSSLGWVLDRNLSNGSTPSRSPAAQLTSTHKTFTRLSVVDSCVYILWYHLFVAHT